MFLTCDLHCSNCPNKCHMIDLMENSTDEQFYQIITINVKIYINKLIICGYIDSHISRAILEKATMTILREKAKYLKSTLND